MALLLALVSVDISMKKIAELPKLADVKKDARLTIRIPRELKDEIGDGSSLRRRVAQNRKRMSQGILRVRREQKKQTPTFPITVTHVRSAIRRLARFQFSAAKEFKTVTLHRT